jgi:enterochelin esterase family protein
VINPATFLDGKFNDGAAINKQFKVLFLGLGTKEPNPFPGSVGAFRNMLDKQGIRYVFYQSPGTSHEWLTWRRDLKEFAQLLFKK